MGTPPTHHQDTIETLATHERDTIETLARLERDTTEGGTIETPPKHHRDTIETSPETPPRQAVGFSDFVLHCLQTLPDFRTGSRCIYVCGDAIVAEGPLHVF